MLVSGSDSGWSRKPVELGKWRLVDNLGEEPRSFADVGVVIAACGVSKGDGGRTETVARVYRTLDGLGVAEAQAQWNAAFQADVAASIDAAKEYVSALGQTSKENIDSGPADRKGIALGVNRTCVSDPKTIKAAKEFLTRLRTVVSAANPGAGLTVAISTAVISLAGLPAGVRADAMAKGIGLEDGDGFIAYQKCLHTEAQVQAMVNKKLLDVKKPMASWKLPCWSCVRLPIVMKTGIWAIERGLTDCEWDEYPAAVFERKAKKRHAPRALQPAWHLPKGEMHTLI
jgi:hypothetical protein